MFGAEPHCTYNRILPSSVLGGFKDPKQLWINPLEWYEKNGVAVHVGVKAEKIDRTRRVVTGAGGKVEEPFDALVLATGSRPFVPPIEGTNQAGVFVFRTLEDCDTIAAYARHCQRAAGMGGGLRFQAGATVDTEMVVISCGIRPNVDEAKAAGLVVDRAIVVDDQLRTSDPGIFAVGECAQHREKNYGLVDPIYEQAGVLAEV